jgi:Cu+-exporting ATPase
MPVKLSADEHTSEAALQHADGSAAKGDAITADSIYTCPMHPDVELKHPANCPKCGMTLELKTVTADTDDQENAELRDMTGRLWIGAALASPVVCPGDGRRRHQRCSCP